MRRATRTRRLSIAATVFLLAFVVVAGASARSFWITRSWHFRGYYVGLQGGRIFYQHLWDSTSDRATERSGYDSWKPRLTDTSHPLKFTVIQMGNKSTGIFIVFVPPWFPLLLLLVAPVRWLIARPANVPAFPIITK